MYRDVMMFYCVQYMYVHAHVPVHNPFYSSMPAGTHPFTYGMCILYCTHVISLISPPQKSKIYEKLYNFVIGSKSAVQPINHPQYLHRIVIVPANLSFR